MRLVKVFVAALVALLISTMGLAAPAGANVDQCAPPGVESASALPTNLAKAATGPGADKYTTATVEPLTAVKVNALGLSTPGTLTVGTLSDAPPSICINSAGQFTGFDNELLRAIAGRLGLNINFVGTEFSGLLAQVASRRFDVGSSSITTTDARRRTVGFTNGYDFGYFSLVVPSGSPITGFEKLAAGQRIFLRSDIAAAKFDQEHQQVDANEGKGDNGNGSPLRIVITYGEHARLSSCRISRGRS